MQLGPRRARHSVTACLAMALLLTAPDSDALAATISPTVNVQGSVLTTGGTPASGDFDMTFRLFTAETGGTEAWSQAVSNVTVASGVFDVALGPFADGFFSLHPSLWLETQVETETLPRKPLRPVATALYAEHAATATSAAGLVCDKCVEASDLAMSAVGVDQLQNAVVTEDKVSFTFAGSTEKGGAANGLDCDKCVDSADVAPGLDLAGSVSVAGTLTACKQGTAGCAIALGQAGGIVVGNDGWVHFQTGSGLRLRDNLDQSYKPLTFGGGTSVGNLTVSGTVSATAFVGDGSGLTNVGGVQEGECAAGKVVVGVGAGGNLICKDLFAGLPDTDNDGLVDIVDTDDDNDKIPDTYDTHPLDATLPVIGMTVGDGTLVSGEDLEFQYSPVTSYGGTLYASWTPINGADKYEVWVGTTPGGDDVWPAETVVAGTSKTFSGLTLKGAWELPVKAYYVTVRPGFGAVWLDDTFSSNGVRIAERKTFTGALSDFDPSADGQVRGLSLKSVAGLADAPAQGAGGWLDNFPSGSSWRTLYGNHYFEQVNIPAGTTVHVSPFGWVDSVPQGVSPSAGSVTNPKDGWVGIYANTIQVAGSIDASGRGYGGGAGGNHGATPSNASTGGASGLSGGGGGEYPTAGYGGGGGGSHRPSNNGTGGKGGPRGGGGGGYSSPAQGASSANASTGAGGSGGGTCGGAGGSADYGGGKGGHNSDSYCGGGGGGGYGAGGGGGAWDGFGGGGGGSGGSGVASNVLVGGKGGGPAGGAGASHPNGGSAGGYAAANGNGDLTTDASLRLGSGGGGGSGGVCCSATNGEGGGGGAAGGGAVRLGADSVLRIYPGGVVAASGGAGGGGGWGWTYEDAASGGGGGGGGGVLVEAETLVLDTGSFIRSLGGYSGQNTQSNAGGHGGDGDALKPNGGTVKILAPTIQGDPSASVLAGRIYIKP